MRLRPKSICRASTAINLVLEQLPIATPVVVGEAEKFRELPRGRLPVAGRHDGVVERNRHEGPADRA
jgi:hypothetical protein